MSDGKNEKPKSLFDDGEEETEDLIEKDEKSEDKLEEPKLEKKTPEKVVETSKKTPKKKGFTKTALLIVFVLFVAMLGIFLGITIMGEKQESFEATTTTTKVSDGATTTTTTKAPENSAYVNSTEGLNLRKEASLNGDIVITMPYGAKLTVTEESGDWIKVEYDNNVGWCMETYTSKDNPLVYKDTEYGFQITFPETWNTYKFFKKEVTESGEKYIYFYVGLKTTDPKFLDGTQLDSSVDAGYSSLFALNAFTKAQWEKTKTAEGPQPTLLTENNNYVFAYSLPNGIAPTDFTDRLKEVKDVLKTFKVL